VSEVYFGKWTSTRQTGVSLMWTGEGGSKILISLWTLSMDDPKD